MARSPTFNKSWLIHYSELLGFWRRKGSVAEDAEDAMQDAALALLEKDGATIDDPRAYMMRSTSNGLISRYRRNKIIDFFSLDDLTEGEHPLMQSTESDAYAKELETALLDALSELPLKCQQVYIYHRLEGWSHTEVADQMSLSKSMVEKYMQRAVHHLAERLQHFSPK
jgi:RNA polymerase sigma factor (sigma-70 family)